MLDIITLQNLSRECTNIKINGNIFRQIKNIEIDLEFENYFYPYYQGKTGYCWLESTLQCVSLYTECKFGKKYFFDDKYLMFFDKLEKANLFFDNILRETDNSVADRHINYFLRNAMTDKGQWQMSVNLIQKYGLVLKDKNEAKSVIKTSELNMYISRLLKIAALKISQICARKKNTFAIEKIRKEIMQRIFNMLVAFYGNQYDTYLSEVIDGLTPLEFYNKNIAFPFDDYISIYPTKDRQMCEIEVLYDGNISELNRNKFLGVSNNQFDKLLNRQLQYDGFCWCSGDFGKFYIKQARALDDSCIWDDLNTLKNIKIDDISRADAFEYGLANMSHAFVVSPQKDSSDYFVYDSAYGLTEGKTCWISHSWFEKYLLQAIVKKEDIKNIESIKKIKEYPWNFFGI